VTTALLFGLAEIYARLPAGSLALGAPHEVAGGDNGAIDGAAAESARLTKRLSWPRQGVTPS
jgi:hypothetical protein